MKHFTNKERPVLRLAMNARPASKQREAWEKAFDALQAAAEAGAYDVADSIRREHLIDVCSICLITKRDYCTAVFGSTSIRICTTCAWHNSALI